MPGERNSPNEVWQRIARIAGAQQGLVTVAQLRGVGLAESTFDEAVSRGLLHRVFRGVYSVGHTAVTTHGRLLAATMACGSGTVVSHRTAAWLLGLRDRRPVDVEVIAPVEAGRKIDGIKRRFVPPPEPWEVGIWKGVPTTGAARVIVDCAGILGRHELADLLEEAALARALRPERIDRILDGPRRRNAKLLLRQLEPWRRYKPGIHLRSRMEAKLLPLLSERGLPIPETNSKLRVAGKTYEVDFLWPRQKVVVETDGSVVHSTPVAGARDGARTRALLAAGYLISRLGWEDLRDRPAETLDELAAALRPR
jgi:very-short-patch-repair endonuclease